MNKKTRRHLSTEKKAELIRKHLVDKKPISEICDEKRPSAECVLRMAATAHGERRSRARERESATGG